MAVLVARLAWLQIANADKYNTFVEKFLDRPGRLLETVRGTIYDCNLRPVSLDRPSFDLCLHYELTRIYDPRFWDIHRLRFFSGDNADGMSASLTRRYLAGRFYLEPDEIRRIISQHSADGRVPLEAIRDVLLAKANSLMVELAQACQMPVDQLFAAINQINDLVYNRRLARARRMFYSNHPELEYESVSTMAALRADFERQVPDPQQRLRFISQCDILEMHHSHTAIADVPNTIALDIEAGFVGTFFSDEASRPISVRPSKSREYPYRDAACHLIGQLRPAEADPCAEIADDDPTGQQLYAYRSGDRQGDWGIEYTFENFLRGRRGWVRYDINHELIDRIEPQVGRDVVMTIDIELQRAIQHLFEANGKIGAAVIIDVPTAEVRAMVSVPTFDLNTFYQADQYSLIMHEMPDLYSLDRAIRVPYQPGSTTKPSTLLAGLELGIVDEHTEFFCPPRDESKPKPQCWSLPGHGDISLYRAIRHSCNTYFIRIAELADWGRLLDYYRRLGFGRRVLAWANEDIRQRAIDAFDETTGNLPPPTLAEMRFAAIGRGKFNGSVLQVANSMATIARDGLFVEPVLVRVPAARPRRDQIAADLRHIEWIQNAMEAVVYNPAGTAYDAFDPLPWIRDQITIYGKTGSTDDALFSCFVRTSDERLLAMAVLVESGEHGGDVAAPLAKDVLLILAEHGYLPAPAYSY